MKIQEDEYEEDTDEEVKENIREGVKELKEVLEGRKKAQPFEEFLKELDEI
ncbi:hypothetical protein [Aquiflexum sp.]|uniref:hypothetical protein n=1 Tax=Aquiflexum sp. TaxID=1872584 RepID=UPI0035946CE9